MKNSARTPADHAPTNRRLRFATPVAVAVLAVTSLGAGQAAARPIAPDTGFAQPFAGNPKYEKFAPTEATSARQINRPLGMKAADRIAHGLGLNKRDAFTPKQYRLFITGKGSHGKRSAAKLVDASVRILTNTTGTPLFSKVNGKVTPTVLGSYGLMVNTAGMLQSPANTDAPTRQINSLLVPGGYLGTWCRHNGANASLRMLYRSAYTSAVAYGNRAQQQSGVAQLVPNQKGATGTIVGMSMAPPLWIVNFALIYTLNPSQAAKMPAWWTPIPADVALAIAESPTGQVPYSQYASSFPG